MKLLKILCIALLTAGVASAIPIGGPNAPDYRGDENSVHAVFEVPHVVFGEPPPLPMQPLVFERGPSNYQLMPIAPEIFDDGISAVVTLPNFIDELPMKKMRIQIEFEIGIPIFDPADIWVDVQGFDPEPVLWNIVGGGGDIINNWLYIDIEMFPNPDYEKIWISTPFMADPIRTIEIDTVSIPEVSSLAAIGLVTALGLFIRRRFLI